MFEKETEQLIGIIRETTIGDAKAVTLRAIFESKVPANVKVFFRAEVEHLLHEDRTKDHRISKFNYDVPEAQMLQEQIDTLLIHNFVFAKSDFEASLDKCVHFLLNFLCRPQWTLASFLFEGPAKVSTQQILRKLRYCKDYEYFPEILRRYVDQREIAEMTPEEGRSLLEKIDGEIVKNHSSVELAQMTKSLFDFIAYARSRELDATGKTIPTRALMYFFEDKKMPDIHDRLEHERETHNVREMSFSQLANLIEKVRTGNERASIFEDEGGTFVASDDFSSEAMLASPSDEDRSLTFPKISEPPKPLPPLFTLEEERAIVKNVFHQNEEQFRTAVKEALGAQSWDDAAPTIDHFFLMNDVEPFTKEAILFTNRLQNRFGEQSNQG